MAKSKKFRFEAPFWAENYLSAFILAAITIAVYQMTWSFEYVLDDKIVMTENEYVQKGLSGIYQLITEESFTGYFGEQKNLVTGARYRPGSLITFAIEHEIFGTNAKVSHIINTLLYALSGILIFRIIFLGVGNYSKRAWYLQIPWLTALFFVLHPIHTEVAANVKGRDEILCLIGLLGSMYFAFRYAHYKKPISLLWLGLVFFAALMCKENTLTFVAIIPLSIYWFSNTKLQYMLNVVWVLLGMSIAYLFLRYQAVGYLLSGPNEITDLMNNPFYGMAIGERMATTFYTLGKYLLLLLFPHPLTHDYYPFHIPIFNWSQWQPWLGLLSQVGLLLLAFYGWKKRRIWSYGIFFYLISLSIVSNIPFTVGTFMNERFIYISSLGYCLILAWFIARMVPRLFGQKKAANHWMSISLLVIITAAYVYKNIDRLPAWENRLTLNEAAIQVSKNSARANLFYGTALYNEYINSNDQIEKDRLLPIIDLHINKALEIHPRYGSALKMLSGIAAEKYKKDKDLDKLLASFKQILIKRPNTDFVSQYIGFLVNRGDQQKLRDWCLEMGRILSSGDASIYPIALIYLEQHGLAVAPQDEEMIRTVAEVYNKMGRSDKAQQVLQQLLTN